MPLVLVVGPSGAGKDTLIRIARAQLAAEDRYVFPVRFVTRPPSADEDNEHIDEASFAEGEALGRFSLSWRAHGLGYGLPADAASLARQGRVVVCNVSRMVVEAARARFAPVHVVEITAPPEILAQRLSARGRAADGDLAARLNRGGKVVPDLTIENGGCREAAAGQFIGYLRSL